MRFLASTAMFFRSFLLAVVSSLVFTIAWQPGHSEAGDRTPVYREYQTRHYRRYQNPPQERWFQHRTVEPRELTREEKAYLEESLEMQRKALKLMERQERREERDRLMRRYRRLIPNAPLYLFDYE